MSKKINAFGRVINNCMPLGKHRVLMKIFAESQFSCCSLIWMLHSKNISLIRLTVSMKEPQELFVLAMQQPLMALLIKTILFILRKKYSKFSYGNLQILKPIISRFPE